MNSNNISDQKIAATLDLGEHPTEVENVISAQKQLVGKSGTVELIVDKIMTDVHNGELLPGDRVSDGDIAQELGISRTPVREALQQLREIGIVEVAANRFTRIAIIEPDEAVKLLTVFIALYSAVLDEVIGSVPDSVIDQLQLDKKEFLRRVDAGNVVHIASAGVDFYLRLVELSDNKALKKGINSVIHVIKIASAHLEYLVGIETIVGSLDELIAASQTGDIPRAKRALNSLAQNHS